MIWERRITWTWSNWTFGIWWMHRPRLRAIGVDIGPLEMVWRQRGVRRR